MEQSPIILPNSDSFGAFFLISRKYYYSYHKVVVARWHFRSYFIDRKGKYAIADATILIHIWNMTLKREDVSKRIGDKLRAIRLSKGLSIEKVANGANIDYTQLSRIELGKINTSIYQIYCISQSLDVPVPQIFHVLDQGQ
jgi:DNA-binding XRE family transcriptional regulator